MTVCEDRSIDLPSTLMLSIVNDATLVEAATAKAVHEAKATSLRGRESLVRMRASAVHDSKSIHLVRRGPRLGSGACTGGFASVAGRW